MKIVDNSHNLIKDGLLLIAITVVVLVITYFATPSKTGQPIRVVVYHKEIALDVAYKLSENKIIKNPNNFLFWARILGYDKKIKAGRYYFTPGMKIFDVLKTLSHGGEKSVLVTIPEGWSIKSISNLLESEGICSAQDFLKACADVTLLNSLNINSKSAEGYLFPDSYDFTVPSTAEAIMQRMIRRFWQVLEEIQDSRLKNQNSIDTIVKIASLVEKEAKLESERPIIASVFYNRLKARMPLQSCATVQYILPNHKEQLSVEDTKIPSPYNTYLHLGLPPTPICNPGRASLIAAIKPAQTKYLYFAVKSNGAHHFSKNFSEHQNFLRNKEKNR